MSEHPAGKSMARAPIWDVIQRVARGAATEEDFFRIFSEYRSMVWRFFGRMGVAIENRGDLTQEVFFRVSTGRGSFKDEKKFKSWILTIARNALRNLERDKRAKKRDGQQESISELPEQDLPAGPTAFGGGYGGSSALENLLAKESLHELEDAIRALPPKMQQCMILRVVEGLSYEEIARVLKVSIETVKAHLHQGRGRLRPLLEARRSRQGDRSVR